MIAGTFSAPDRRRGMLLRPLLGGCQRSRSINAGFSLAQAAIWLANRLPVVVFKDVERRAGPRD